jgi:hypothetical protein
MIQRVVRTTVVLIAVAAATACGGKAFQYRSQNEIPPGPGLLSGEEGAFVLHRAPQAQTVPAGGQATAPSAADDAATRGGSDAAAADREFEAYRQYLRAKAEGSAEYREFLEWLEWKAYLRRKEGQDVRAR